jgi:hypothetical protein
MTLEEQNQKIQIEVKTYPDWRVKDLIQQMRMYNTPLEAYSPMIEFLENELSTR